MTNANANEGGSAVREIAGNGAYLQEARELAPALEAALAPADDEETLTVLLAECVPFGINGKGRQDAEWLAMWAPYLRALDGMPVACVREAFAMWNRNEMYPTEKGRHAFYPRPAELHALASQARNKLGMMRHRVRAALAHEESRAPPKRTHMSKAEMIEAGYLNPDGSVNLRPASVAQATAAALAENSERARAAGVPITRPPPPEAEVEEAV